MAVVSPVSQRTTVACLLLLTFSTGIVDAISVLVLGHVFVANMTGNVIFLGFWFAPHTVVDMPAALVAFVSFVTGAILGGRLSRHLDGDVRRCHRGRGLPVRTTQARGNRGLVSAHALSTRHRCRSRNRQVDRSASGGTWLGRHRRSPYRRRRRCDHRAGPAAYLLSHPGC